MNTDIRNYASQRSNGKYHPPFVRRKWNVICGGKYFHWPRHQHYQIKSPLFVNMKYNLKIPFTKY